MGRLKKARITESNDVQPAKRTPKEAVFQPSPNKNEPNPFDSNGSMMDHHNPISLTNAINNGFPEKRFKTENEQDDNTYELNILTPSPDDRQGLNKSRYYSSKLSHPSPSHVTHRIKKESTEVSTFLMESSPMLTPDPDPEPGSMPEEEGVFAAIRLDLDN